MTGGLRDTSEEASTDERWEMLNFKRGSNCD